MLSLKNLSYGYVYSAFSKCWLSSASKFDEEGNVSLSVQAILQNFNLS